MIQDNLYWATIQGGEIPFCMLTVLFSRFHMFKKYLSSKKKIVETVLFLFQGGPFQ